MIRLKREPKAAVVALVAAAAWCVAAAVHLLCLHQVEEVVGHCVIWGQVWLVRDCAVGSLHGLVPALGGSDLLAHLGHVSRVDPQQDVRVQ
jgi:hypothetical protein